LVANWKAQEEVLFCACGFVPKEIMLGREKKFCVFFSFFRTSGRQEQKHVGEGKEYWEAKIGEKRGSEREKNAKRRT